VSVSELACGTRKAESGPRTAHPWGGFGTDSPPCPPLALRARPSRSPHRGFGVRRQRAAAKATVTAPASATATATSTYTAPRYSEFRFIIRWFAFRRIIAAMNIGSVAKQTCGGSQNNPCPTGQYCEQFGLLCDGSGYCPDNLSACGYVNSGGLGTCRPLPTSAQCSGQTEAVCGCDGVTYANDCARISANAAWAHSGACIQGRTDAGRDAANLPDFPQSRDLRAEATSDLGNPETYSDSAGGLAGDAGMADAPASP
jgi:hypothetical protein